MIALSGQFFLVSVAGIDFQFLRQVMANSSFSKQAGMGSSTPFGDLYRICSLDAYMPIVV